MTDRSLIVKDYRFTVPRDKTSEMQDRLEKAALAGQSPYSFQSELGLKEMVLAVWGLDLFGNRRQDRSLTELHVPSATSLQTFDTFLSLIAAFVAMDKPAYFDVVCQAEEGDQEFFYHFENGKVIKEERITMYIPAELEIRTPGATSEAREG
jgi:hypothetical protein